MEKQIKENVIILGAGAPHRGEIPSFLWKTSSSKVILNWILEALKFPNLSIKLVAGYKANYIKDSFPEIEFSINENWKKMASTGSLLAQNIDCNKPLLVSYGDILFRRSIIKKLLLSKKPIAVVFDSEYKENFSKRSINFKEKIQVVDKKVYKLGIDLPIASSNGSFIGLIRLQPEVLKEINSFDKKVISKLESQHLSFLIEILRLRGYEIEAIDVKGDWAEVVEIKDIASFILGTKAKTLKRLQKMVVNSKIENQICFTKELWEQNNKKIISSVLNLFGKKQDLIIRSSSKREDCFDRANAGKFKSILNVKPQIKNIVDSIEEVIQSFGEEVDKNDEVLIQPMLSDVIASGVSFTRTLENASPWYVINYEEGNDTKSITSGSSKDHKTLFIKRNFNANINIESPIWIKHLLSALKEIEELLFYDALDIEFAVNKKYEIFILQVRPITNIENKKFDDNLYYEKINIAHKNWNNLKKSPPHIPGNAKPAYGLMPDWNPAEIIGTSPNELALTLYKYLITDEIWAQQRSEFGYIDVRPSPLIVNFLGKPYIDIRLSFCSFIPKALSFELAGKLLNFYLQYLEKNEAFHDKVEFKVLPTCITPRFEIWENILINDAFLNAYEVNCLKKELTYLTKEAFEKPKLYLAKINQLKIRNQNIINSSLDHLEKARLLIEDCKILGTLPFAHLARCGFIAISLLNDSYLGGFISSDAKDSFLSSIRTISHNFKVDSLNTSKGKMRWEDFTRKYGHLRPGTYDINSPRYDSNDQFFLKNSINNNSQDNLQISLDAWVKERQSFFNSLKLINLPYEEKIVEEFLYNSIEGREYAKFIFTKNLSDALEELVSAFKNYGLTREDLSNLDLQNILKLRDYEINDKMIIEQLKLISKNNRNKKEILSFCKSPHLIFKEDDLDVFFVSSSIPNFIGSKLIISKYIEIMDEPYDTNICLKDKIVLINRADPGYDWIFSHQIRGLITLYGGANSHMAIRCAEFNITAAIGVGEKIYNKLFSSNIIKIDPINKKIQNL